MGPSHEPRLRVAIIGVGRMGRALERASGRASMDVVGMITRRSFDSLAVMNLDAVLIAVPDDGLADVVESLPKLQGSPLVVVTSGAASIDALSRKAPQLRLVRIHPMQSITLDAPDDVLDGVTAAVTAQPADRADAHRIAARLGMVTFDMRDEDAAMWHAGGVLAAGAVTTLLSASQALAVAAGLDPARALSTMVALARTAVDRAGEAGPGTAMTGPVVRGDVSTIAAHLDALDKVDPDLRAAYVALTRVSVRVARDADRIDDAAAVSVLEALGEVPTWA